MTGELREQLAMGGYGFPITLNLFALSARRAPRQSGVVVTSKGHPVMSKNFASLIFAYKNDPDSPFHKLRYHTRQHYQTLCDRLEVDLGAFALEDIKARQLLHWNAAIVDAGHLPMAHALIGMVRTTVNFGATILESPECERLSGMLHKMRFKMAKPRDERLTAEQVDLIRIMAQIKKKPSIALAQAFQFECILRQKDCIGEWVPVEEPGWSDVVDNEGFKWLRGIRWEEIDDNFVLTHTTSKRQKVISIDLTQAPMIVEELNRAVGESNAATLHRQDFPASGPLIFCESTNFPWIAGEFRRWWRKLAREAGIPDHIKNMDSRAGAISEATDAGADLEHVRHAATHSDIAMTQKYSRGAAEKIANVQRARNEHRVKEDA